MKKDINADEVLSALSRIGENSEARDLLIQSLVEIEEKFNYPKNNIRDEITVPILDAVMQNSQTITRKIESGLVFNFEYDSKISREFLLANRRIPNHVWEPQTTKLLTYFSGDAKTVLIGGAYFGDQGIIVANTIKKNGGVCHAFEPSTKQAQLFDANAKLNNLDNVVINNYGLWDESDKSLEFVGEDALASSQLASSNGSGYTFKTVTVDDYFTRQGLKSIDLIMIDVEGAEFKVLQGAKKVLAEHSPVVVFESHSLYSDWSNGLANAEVVKYLNSFGYHVFSIRDFHSNYEYATRNKGEHKIELIPVEDTYIEGPPHGFNLLAIKDVSKIENENFIIVHNLSPKLLLHKDSELYYPKQ